MLVVVRGKSSHLDLVIKATFSIAQVLTPSFSFFSSFLTTITNKHRHTSTLYKSKGNCDQGSWFYAFFSELVGTDEERRGSEE